MGSNGIRGRLQDWVVIALVALVWLRPGAASAQFSYQKPPKAVLDVLNAPAPPQPFMSPAHDTLLLADPVRYPPVADLSQPMLRLAGVRINPRTNGVHGAPYFSGFMLKRMADGSQSAVKLPAGARLGTPHFSADGKLFAFSNTTRTGIELWVGEAATASARRMEGVQVNGALSAAGPFGQHSEIEWMPDQRTLLVRLIPSGRGAAPAQPEVPQGPNIQQSMGDSSPSSTYEVRDVLKNAHDADLFDYYATAQLALVDTQTGKISLRGKPAVYSVMAPAPDGEHILVERIHRPYSYLHPYERFPREVEVWSRRSDKVYKLASLPLADHVPIRGVPTGPRDHRWRSTEPATLLWVEALDGGDPRRKVAHRDRVRWLKAPFTGQPTELCKAELRVASIVWTEKDGLALISELDLERHWRRTILLDVNAPSAAPRIVSDLSSDDRYKDPGRPVLRTLANGQSVLHQDGEWIYLAGDGASPDGNRPFLDRMSLRTLKTERQFRSDKTSYESFLAWVESPQGRFITRRETPADPPNYFVRTLTAPSAGGPGEASMASTLKPLTAMRNPTPQLGGITKRLVRYQRPDGVQLSFTLYLPPGYRTGTRLPTVVWAYPLDYTDAAVAGQVAGSTQRFTTIAGPSHLFFLLAGYAVIDNPAMPVIGPPDTAYDTFVEQITANAKAAVDKSVELGVTDRERVGVMGHSHGALMTANLLAHSDLFRAGIARSGAYNHTMRPFGFQNERRTLWEAPETYVKLSPLMHAPKIKKPLLLIHGEADFNPGTVPVQSQRLYEAIRGTGGTVRLVMLPFESHGYAARESIEHTLYEMLTWFDRYVKNPPERKQRRKTAAR